MNRTFRAAVALAASACTIAFTNTAHAATYRDLGVVRLGAGDASTLDTALGVVVDLAARAGTCVPKSWSTTIHDPSAHVYYGTLDSIYVWEDLGEAAIEGCPNNTVTVKVQMADEALDASGSATPGNTSTGSGKARAGAIAELTQRYGNVTMATGLSYHQLTTVVTATQTDGRTTTAWCAKKSWVYLATVAGPQFVGSTDTEDCRAQAST